MKTNLWNQLNDEYQIQLRAMFAYMKVRFVNRYAFKEIKQECIAMALTAQSEHQKPDELFLQGMQEFCDEVLSTVLKKNVFILVCQALMYASLPYAIGFTYLLCTNADAWTLDLMELSGFGLINLLQPLVLVCLVYVFINRNKGKSEGDRMKGYLGYGIVAVIYIIIMCSLIYEDVSFYTISFRWLKIIVFTCFFGCGSMYVMLERIQYLQYKKKNNRNGSVL